MKKEEGVIEMRRIAENLQHTRVAINERLGEIQKDIWDLSVALRKGVKP